MKIKILFPIALCLVMLFTPAFAFGKISENPPAAESASGLLYSSRSSQPSGAPEIKQQKSYKNLDMDSFLILNESTGKVDRVSVKDYVTGAVMSEMPAAYETEALKAQAVAAHTYALRSRENQKKTPDPALKGADFKADPQKYLGYMTIDIAKERFGENFDAYYKKISGAVNQVLDEALIYKDEPIVAAYHAISAGRTEAASNVWQGGADYLMPVDSGGDKLSPEYEVETVLSSEEVKEKLESVFASINLPENPENWFEIKTRSDSGYITEVHSGGLKLTGLELRNALGLRSSDLILKYSGGYFTFTTFGYGHGVGLSQYGSDYMARQGKNYREILLHYYTGAELVNVKK
ncbi:MAG: stage II sporulation protein D [Oscillospiraceae bacterium]|jgi:stage II sporulation protein D|nr:stage II sporulation protein D [Oscillospiraceae bacterium]